VHETQLGSLVLSERLASLELTSLDAAELSQLIADEALRLLGGERAVVWLYRPALRRLFVEQKAHEIRSLDVDRAAAEELFRQPTCLSDAPEGIWYEVVEASFGLALEGHTPQILALPLCAGGTPVALLLIETHGEGWSAEVGAAARDGPDPLREAFAAQAGTLLANHDALIRSRRHEAQLEALYRTVGEISAKLDQETVLHAIIERSRQLVGTPISYITLVDSKARELFMRATVGTRSAAFDRIELRIGTGLGGVAAKEVRAIYTSDYLNDARFEHDPAVDAAVRAEGVKSILGVPMSASEDFIGVLYVADRAIRVFTDADVEILLSLARHAAVAIDNAVLYERTTAALSQVQAVNEVVARQNDLLTRASEAHRRLSEAVLEGQGLDGAVSLISELTGGQIVIMDQRTRVLAVAGEPADDFGRELAAEGLSSAAPDRYLRLALRELSSPTMVFVEPDPPTRTRGRLVAPLIARAEVMGSIWVECDSGERELRALTEEAARVVALELLKERSVAEVERRLGRELLDELLSERTRLPEGLERRALELGLDLSRPRHLAVAQATHEGLTSALARAGFCAFVAEHSGRTVALLESEARRTRERLSRLLAAVEGGREIRIVLSPICTEIADYRRQFLACDRALALLGDYLTAPVVDLDELGILSLLLREGDEEEVRSFVASRLQPVIEQDGRRGTQLTQTLDAYYQAGCSPRRTAGALHVHVNTVYYRLERIKELLGVDLSAPRAALDLQVALLARRLLHQGRLESTSKQALESS
jgi:DNA-binding PucR family transcriptional regulator